MSPKSNKEGALILLRLNPVEVILLSFGCCVLADGELELEQNHSTSRAAANGDDRGLAISLIQKLSQGMEWMSIKLARKSIEVARQLRIFTFI